MLIENFTAKSSCCILLLFISHSLLVNAQKSNTNLFKSVLRDTTKIISPAEAKLIAVTFQAKAYKKIVAPDKMYLDKELQKLNEKDPIKLKAAANTLSSTGVLLMGASAPPDLAIVYSSAAASTFPEEPVMVNNFGAVLRMLDSLEVALKYFLYAKSLDPKSPLILTNLGNTFFELYDDKNAEIFYTRALKIDNHFALARQGMVEIYLKRKELGKAYEELLKGVEEVSYSESTQQALDGLKSSGKAKEAAGKSSSKGPPKPSNSGNESNGNNSTGANDQLKLPPFPNWTDMKALINANGPKQWQNDLNKRSSAVIEKMTENGKGWKNIAYSARKYQFAMEMQQEFTSIQLDKIMHDYNKADSIASAKMNRSIEQVSLIYSDKSKVIAKQMETATMAESDAKTRAALGEKISKQEADKIAESTARVFSLAKDQQKLIIERCHKIKTIVEDYFGEWKPLAKIKHDKTMDLLSEYWIYCEQYLNQIYDTHTFNQMNESRKLFVIMQSGLLPSEYGVRQFSFAILLGSAMTDGNGNCPESPAPLVASSGENTETNVPDGKAPPCPFKGEKAKIGLGPVTLSLDCESIGVGYAEGVAASASWNFKKKETTLFVGVGFSASASLGIIRSDISYTQGVSVTFDKAGQPTDIGIVQEFTALNRTVNMTLAASTGLNTSLTKEYNYVH